MSIRPLAWQKQHERIRMFLFAQPGTRILICDENEKGVLAHDRFLPWFKRTFQNQREDVVAPVNLVPTEMREVRLFDVWKGWMFCFKFHKLQENL